VKCEDLGKIKNDFSKVNSALKILISKDIQAKETINKLMDER
jgi:hypothetical protein